MTMLFITAFPPNQKTGGQTFSMNAIKELSQKYDIDLLYFDYLGHECEASVYGNIKSVQKLEIKKFGFLRYFWMHPVFSRRFDKKILAYIKSIAGKYDILYFDFSQVALYSLYVMHPYKIVRMHDVLCQKFGRKNPLLAYWICSTERKIVRSCSKVFVPSLKDVEIVKNRYGVSALYTNEYLKSLIFPANVLQKKYFVFYGYWKRRENIDGLLWFIQNVLPLLREKHVFTVIGGGMSADIRQRYLEPNGFSYLGFVDNPLEMLLEVSAVIVPLFQGAGIKVKVIDAFSAGTPVIGTSLAFEGLPNMQELQFNASTAEEFADRLNVFKPLSYEQKKKEARFFDFLYNNHHLLEQI